MASNRYDLEILIRTRKQGDGVEQAGRDVENLGKRLNSTLNTINQSVVAAAAAGATFKQAFDLAKEGAQLQFAEERFDKLAASIGTTADALQNRLREATGGLVSDSELIASATDLISLGLGKNEEEVVRLATVIGKLGLDMQQVILTFANNSTARLDALGLSVEGVTQKAAELEAQGFEGDAFDQAVLESLEEKLALVGDAADSDVAAFLRLETQVKNTSDAFKEWLANGLLPVVEAVSSGYDQQVEGIIDSNVEMAKSFDELVIEAQKIDDAGNILGGLGTAVTGTSGAFREGIIDISTRLAAGAESFDQFEAATAEWSAKSRNHLYNYLRANDLTLEGFYEMANAQQEQAAQAEILANSQALLAEKMERTQTATSGMSAATRELVQEAAAYDDVLLQNYGTMQEAENAARAFAESFMLLDDSAGSYFVKAADGELTQDNLNQRIFDSAEAAGASATELAVLGGALGLYTDEAVEAALKTALIQAEIDRLAEAYANGETSVVQMKNQLNAFIAELDGTTGVALEVAAALDSIPANIRTHISVTSDPIPNLPTSSGTTGAGNQGTDAGVQARAAGGPVFDGGLYQVGEGNAPELLRQNGRLFLIPGDDGRVFSNQQSQGMLGGGFQDNSRLTINNYDSTAAAITNAMVQERQRRKIDQFMGVG